MDSEIARIRKKIKVSSKSNSHRSKYLTSLFTRVLLSIIFILVSVIYIKYSNNNLINYKKIFLTDTLPFTKIENTLSKYFGENKILKKVIDDTTTPVFNETLKYTDKSMFYDGCGLNVDQNYLTPLLESGLVVFIGEKENYGNTVIIQGVDGVDIWYGNVINLNVTLYEYVEKGTLLGEVNGNNLYLVFQKDGKYLDYEKYV